MKIKKIKLNNFAKFIDFEVEFKGNITHLVGVNGSGKTTIGLTAIWAGLKGIAEKNAGGQLFGERFRFIGSKKASADIEITLIDEKKNNAEIKIKNHITKQSNQISFEAPDDYAISNEWLNNLLSVAFMSAKNFTQMNSKEQALLLGINTSKFDTEIKALKEQFTDANRELKALGTPEPMEKTEKVSVSELVKQKDEIDTFNEQQKTLLAQKAAGELYVQKRKEAIEEYKEKIRLLEIEMTNGERALSALPAIQGLKDTSAIIQQISDAESINEKATAYEVFTKTANAINTKQEVLSQNKQKQAEVSERRLKFIESFDFGIKGVSANEDGELMIDERPVKEQYFSKGELEMIVARLHAHINPEMKVRFIDDFELLDDQNQQKLVTRLLDEGFQVITAECHYDKNKHLENVLLLKECKIAGEL